MKPPLTPSWNNQSEETEIESPTFQPKEKEDDQDEKRKIIEEKEIFNKEKNLLDSDESFEKPFKQNQTEKEENEKKMTKIMMQL